MTPTRHPRPLPPLLLLLPLLALAAPSWATGQVNDTFTLHGAETAGELLTAHTSAEDGTAWANGASANAVVTAAGEARANNSATGVTVTTTALPAGAEDITFDLDAKSVAGESGVLFAYSDSANYYRAYYSQAGGNVWAIAKRVGNAETYTTAAATLTPGTVYHCKVMVRASGVTLQVKTTGSYATVVSTTDDETGGGAVGLYLSGSSPTDSTGLQLDNLLTAAFSSSSITPSPTSVNAYSGSNTISLTGVGTTWTGSTAFTASATGSPTTPPSIVSKANTDGTHESVVLNPGSTAAGQTITISDGTTTSSAITVNASAVSVGAISPSAPTVGDGATQAFSATVTGTTNTALTWTATAGSFTGSTWTAPSSGSGTATITATSAADPSKTATTTATYAAAVAVSVSPALSLVVPSGTRQLTATVTGTGNTAVTWSVTGGSPNGTVTSGGLYTAPATPGTYSVVATSSADGTKTATATITVGALVSLPATASFGAGNGGLSAGYTLVNNDGTTLQSRVTAGVLDLSGGNYGAPLGVPAGFKGFAVWDTGGGSPLYAAAPFEARTLTANAANVTLALAASFGAGNNGLTTGYTLLNTDGTTYAARTTAGVRDLGAGSYGALVTVPGTFLGFAKWDTGTSLYSASPVLGLSEVAAASGGVKRRLQ